MQRGNRKESCRVAVFQANPKGTDHVRLDKEANLIEEKRLQSKLRNLFEIKIVPAFKISDLMRVLVEFKPRIVVFCGHGAGTDGIICENEKGEIKLIPTVALGHLFETVSSYVECVVLNSCFSSIQATELVKHIPYVVGMDGAIGDEAGVGFSGGFHTGLFGGLDIPACYQLGKNAIELENIPEHLTPILMTKTPTKAAPQAGTTRLGRRVKAPKAKSTTAVPRVVVPPRGIQRGRRSFFKFSITALAASLAGWELKAAVSKHPLDGIYRQKDFLPRRSIPSLPEGRQTPGKPNPPSGFSLGAHSCIVAVSHTETGYIIFETTQVRLTLERLDHQVIGGYTSTWVWTEFRRTNPTTIEASTGRVNRGNLKKLQFKGFAGDSEEADAFDRVKDYLNIAYDKTMTSTWRLEGGGHILRKSKSNKDPDDLFYLIEPSDLPDLLRDPSDH